jgi:hypothetical protein
MSEIQNFISPLGLFRTSQTSICLPSHPQDAAILDVGRGASDGLRQMNENRPNLVISASDFSDLQQSLLAPQSSQAIRRNGFHA